MTLPLLTHLHCGEETEALISVCAAGSCALGKQSARQRFSKDCEMWIHTPQPIGYEVVTNSDVEGPAARSPRNPGPVSECAVACSLVGRASQTPPRSLLTGRSVP
jgi:hypothetical protein